ncbi:MAG: hypothetical protein Q9195_001994 [Heterodermia aff. obscurata]
MSDVAKGLTKRRGLRKKTRAGPNGGAGDRGETQSSRVVDSQKKEGRVAMADAKTEFNAPTHEQKRNGRSEERMKLGEVGRQTIEVQYLQKTAAGLWRRKVRRRGSNQMRALFALKALARQTSIVFD